MVGAVRCCKGKYRSVISLDDRLNNDSKCNYNKALRDELRIAHIRFQAERGVRSFKDVVNSCYLSPRSIALLAQQD